MDPAAILETDTLSKSYGSIVALRSFSLKLNPGIVGILGPNGAGKTTLLKLALGLLKPTSGTIRVLGLSPYRAARELRTRIGYVPEEDSFWEGLSAVGSVVYAGRLCRMTAREALRKAHEMLDWVGFTDDRYRLAETLSMGMRQRLRFAMALVHSPKLLILDEPTRHLDPAGRAQILSRLADLSKQGVSILISTHQLDEVEKICDSVAMISSGTLLLNAPIASLLKNLNQYELQPIDTRESAQNVLDSLQIQTVWEGDKARFQASPEAIDRLVERLGRDRCGVRLLRPVPMTLDEVLPSLASRNILPAKP